MEPRTRPPFLSRVLVTLALATACTGRAAGPQDEQRSRAEYDLARDFWMEKGNTRSALNHALKATDLDENNAEAAHLVSLLYLDFCSTGKGDCRLKEAEAFARRALASSVAARAARNTLGVVLVHSKRYEEAIQVLLPLTQDMLYQTPENAWGNLGWAYLEAGRLDEAIDALRRSVAAQPGFCVGHLRLGTALEKKARHVEALEAYSAAVDNQRPVCQRLQGAAAGRGRLLLKIGKPMESRKALERCVALDQKSDLGKECRTLLADLG